MSFRPPRLCHSERSEESEYLGSGQAPEEILFIQTVTPERFLAVLEMATKRDFLRLHQVLNSMDLAGNDS